MSEKKASSVSAMSLKRLQDIRRLLEENKIHNVDDIITGICDIMKFDPNYRKGMYSQQHKERMRAWRAKKTKDLEIQVATSISEQL